MDDHENEIDRSPPVALGFLVPLVAVLLAWMAVEVAGVDSLRMEGIEMNLGVLFAAAAASLVTARMVNLPKNSFFTPVRFSGLLLIGSAIGVWCLVEFTYIIVWVAILCGLLLALGHSALDRGRFEEWTIAIFAISGLIAAAYVGAWSSEYAYLPDSRTDTDEDGLQDWYENSRMEHLDSNLADLSKSGGDTISPFEATHSIRPSEGNWTNLSITIPPVGDDSLGHFAVLIVDDDTVSSEGPIFQSGSAYASLQSGTSSVGRNQNGFSWTGSYNFTETTGLTLALSTASQTGRIEVVLIEMNSGENLADASARGSSLLSVTPKLLDPAFADSNGDGISDASTMLEGNEQAEGSIQMSLGVSENTIVDAKRLITGQLFFAIVFTSIVLGFLVAVLQRGILLPEGSAGWWSFMPQPSGRTPSRAALPLYVALFAGVLGFLLEFISFSLATPVERISQVMPQSVFCADETGFGSLFGVNCGVHFIGSWWPILNFAASLIIAYLWSERMRTRALMGGATWILYTASSWQEMGMWSTPILEGSSGKLLWFGITFITFIAIYLWSTHEKYGQWSPRNERGQASMWLSSHGRTVMLWTAFAVGLAVRIQWNVVPAMNASGTSGWDMTGGSDPWYMKRAIDYVLAQHAHFMFDPDRAYPIGDINPRPPLFGWSIALAATLLGTLTGMDIQSEAVWWALGFMPAFFGALIVFPIYALTKDVFDKNSAIIASWLIALMPGHVSHSTFALADHDAYVLLFLSLAYFCYLRAVKEAGMDRLVKKISWRPQHIIAAFSAVHRERPKAVIWAILAGISMAAVALGWKGFVYGLGILYIAFFLQVAVNLFRRTDSTALSVIMIEMQLVVILISLPFYGHPSLGLLSDPTGFQPLFYIFGFTVVTAFIAVSYRDKPWLLVLGTGIATAMVFLVTLWILLWADISNAWNVLFTGGGYFSKNKIFGTIAEAQAPARGVLFGSFGPFVGIFALFGGFVALWHGLKRRQANMVVISVWTLVSAYMAWTAGRFVFNATPPIAVVGAWSFVVLWGKVGGTDFAKTWRRLGVSTPRARISATRASLRRHPWLGAVSLVFLIIAAQHVSYGVDAGIPRGSSSMQRVDQAFYDIAPDLLRTEFLGLSVMNSQPHEGACDQRGYQPCRYLNSFGPGFNGPSWNKAYDWLAHQDLTHPDANTSEQCTALSGIWHADSAVCEQRFGDRPAFVSWWDYGFQALSQGQHPTVADNFQTGIPSSGNMLLSRGQDDLLALFITRLADGDRQAYDASVDGDCGEALGRCFTRSFNAALDAHFTNTSELEEFKALHAGLTSTIAKNRFLAVKQTAGTVILAEGAEIIGGMPTGNTIWKVYDNRNPIACSQNCRGDAYATEAAALQVFDDRSASRESTQTTTHYIIGDYWYTADTLDEFDSVATSLHRSNARIALMRNFLSNSQTMNQMVDLYANLTKISYSVKDSFGQIGDTLERNHDIRYFAVDNRLYPLGGRYNEDANYHGGQPQGIFHAPTRLAGLDLEHHLATTYETMRGTGGLVDEMTAAEYEETMRTESLAQTSNDQRTTLKDIRVDQDPIFFETMVARTYVGYGATSLGLPDAAQPNPHFQYSSGTPSTALQSAYPLPGAMLNHFVISNWDEVDSSNPYFSKANTGVKVLKYYHGLEINGKVTLDIDGKPGAGGVRLLVERDAFSGEMGDDDQAVYWIPIAAVDAEPDGSFHVRVPAGKIRITAFVGQTDLDTARTSLQTSNVRDMIYDLIDAEGGSARTVNTITGILGGVAGMQWLSQEEIIVLGDEASEPGHHRSVELTVSPSGADGVLSWTGLEEFENIAVEDVNVRLENIDNGFTYNFTTSNGSYDGSRLIVGEGEAEFIDEPGQFDADGIATVNRFTGNLTRTIESGHIYADSGHYSGTGWFNGTIDDDSSSWSSCNSNGTMPENASRCLASPTSVQLRADSVNGTGRFAADSTSTFTKSLVSARYVGSGSFEGVGIANGTGRFNGSGIFSGPMIKQGSFYFVDAMPGRYNVSIDFGPNQSALLPEPLLITLEPVTDLALQVGASRIHGELRDHLNDPVSLNLSLILAENEALISMEETDAEGLYEFSPLPPGTYWLRTDTDLDGLYEYNQTFIFDAEPSNETFSPPFLPMIDLDLTIRWDNGSGLVPVPEGHMINLTSPDGQFSEVAIANETGQTRLEIPKVEGVSFLVVETANTAAGPQILTFEVSLGSDQTLVLDYQPSAVVSGTLRIQDPGQQTGFSTPKGVDVHYTWGNYSLASKSADEGVWSQYLPASVNVNITAQTFGPTVGGIRVNVPADGLTGQLINMESAVTVTGQLIMAASNVSYDGQLPGWLFAEIMAVNQATDANGLVWKSSVDEMGQYQFAIPDGTYDVSVSESRLGMAPFSLTVVFDENSTVFRDITLEPDNITVNLSIFLDSGRDGDLANGTLRPTTIILNPYGRMHGSILEINATDMVDGNGTTLANISVSLAPGLYEVLLEPELAEDPNASDHQQRPNAEILIPVEVDGDVKHHNITLAPEWLFTGELQSFAIGDSGDNLVRNTSFLLEPANSSDGLTPVDVPVDENGTFAMYIPEGDYVILVDAFLPKEGEGRELLRQALSVQPNNGVSRTNLTLTTSQPATVNLTLWMDAGNGSALAATAVKAVSNSGLGNVTLPPLNSSGFASAELMPGNWSLELNETIGDQRHILADSARDLGVLNAGSTKMVNLTSSTSVRIGGKVFYDLDGDNLWDQDESLMGAEVQITNSTSSVSLNSTSDGTGTWVTFVPVDLNYSIHISMDGYDNSSFSRKINSTHDSNDTALTAGEVPINGTVSWALSDPLPIDAVVRILPVIGQDSDRSREVTLPLVNGTWNGTWEQLVSPGDYVVYASANHSSEVIGYVGVTYVHVGVNGTDTVSVTLDVGALLKLDSTWTNYDGNSTHLGELPAELAVVQISIDLEDGRNWNETIDSDGTVELLLPVSGVQADVEFSLVERGRMMNYSGGLFAQLPDRVTIERTIEASRIRDHSVDVDLIYANGSVADALSLQSARDVNDHYAPVLVQARVSYLGTESLDEIQLTASMGVGTTIPTSWNLTFSDSENGPWNQTKDLTLGLDSESSAVVWVRVLPPPANESTAKTGGDVVQIRANSGSTTKESTFKIELDPKREVVVRILTETLSLGRGSSGEVELSIDNLGNGEEKLEFELVGNPFPAAWSVPTPSSAVVDARIENRTHLIPINAPIDADVTYSETIQYLIRGEDGNVRAEVSFKLDIAQADVRIISVRQANIATVGGSILVDVDVVNDGPITTSEMTVWVNATDNSRNASLPFQLEGGQNRTLSLTLPSGDRVSTFEIDVDLDIGETDHVSGLHCDIGVKDDHCQQIRLTVDATQLSEPSNALPIVIALVLAAIAIAIVLQRIQKSPKGPRF